MLHYSSAPAMALPAAGSHPVLQPQDGDKMKWTPAVTLSVSQWQTYCSVYDLVVVPTQVTRADVHTFYSRPSAGLQLHHGLLTSQTTGCGSSNI